MVSDRVKQTMFQDRVSLLLGMRAYLADLMGFEIGTAFFLAILAEAKERVERRKGD